MIARNEEDYADIAHAGRISQKSDDFFKSPPRNSLTTLHVKYIYICIYIHIQRIMPISHTQVEFLKSPPTFKKPKDFPTFKKSTVRRLLQPVPWKMRLEMVKRNANRNPEWWGDFSQLVKIEKTKFLGISPYKVEWRF